MKVSQLIKELQELQKRHGDLEVMMPNSGVVSDTSTKYTPVVDTFIFEDDNLERTIEINDQRMLDLLHEPFSGLKL